MKFLNKNIILLFLLTFSVNAQPIILNEIMSSNISALADEDDDYPDWIEIYNPTDSIISLSGYSLSDDIKLPNKWIFPNINLNPNNYLVIFASGKNRTGEYLHTNFKIKSSGENVRLRDSFGHVVDSIKSIPIPSDHSLGRSKDDQSLWLFFDVPTPSTANNSTGFLASAETPNLSIQSGFYSGTISVNIFSNDEQAQIYYTEDGSEPNLNSNLFTNDLTINSTTVIKAKSFGDDLLPSATATRSFFINENSTLPVVSISTDPKNLWDDEIGIYTAGTNGIIGYGSTEPKNYNQPWERPANLEFFETDGSIQINMGVGIKIHGGWSRQNPQKSLEIFSESHYGGKSIPYKLFPNREFKEYNAFLLRNSGQDNQSTFFRDAMMQSLVEGLDMETEAYRPALVYLNGEYWGIHNIRERMNKHYIAQHKGVDSDAIDVLRNRRTVVKGSADHYDAMYSFIQNNNMSLAENYSYIEAQMDIDNYISYIIAEMYFVNIDWFPNNMKFWRPQTSDGKWRWMLKDTDWGFGLYSPLQVMVNMFGVITSPDNHPSVVFNGLIQNSDFKNKFINRFADFSNTRFYPNTVVSKIQRIKENIETEMPRHFTKWGNNLADWNSNIDVLKNFAQNRIPYLQQQFISQFNLGGLVNLAIGSNLNEGVKVKLNNIEINNFPWDGEYFLNTSVELEAVSKTGIKFVEWVINGNVKISDRETTLTLTENNVSIEAIFETDILSDNSVVINEINYNSSTELNSQDWIELANISDSEIDISGWNFKDQNDDNNYEIPMNTILKSKEYIVLSEDTTAVKDIFPEVKNLIGNFNFKLSNEGETLRIFDNNNFLIDSISYGIDLPWPAKPNGNGSTLELKDELLDNSNVDNWQASFTLGGTPGKVNSSDATSADKNSSQLPTKYFISQNYPNPFNPSTTIKYEIPSDLRFEAQDVRLEVFDVLGKEVATLVNEKQKSGFYKVTWDASSQTSGVYFYRIKVGEFIQTQKMILLR